jgi:type III secretory pathway lipoprotein EscJ
MNIDSKNLLLKASVSENKLAYKNIDVAIDQSSISSTSQKSLDMESNKKEAEVLNLKNKKFQKKQSNKSTLSLAVEKEDFQNKIERDPMKLLKLI